MITSAACLMFSYNFHSRFACSFSFCSHCTLEQFSNSNNFPFNSLNFDSPGLCSHLVLPLIQMKTRFKKYKYITINTVCTLQWILFEKECLLSLKFREHFLMLWQLVTFRILGSQQQFPTACIALATL